MRYMPEATNRQTDRYIQTLTFSRTVSEIHAGSTDRYTDRQIDRQIDGQTYIQTDRQTHTGFHGFYKV